MIRIGHQPKGRRPAPYGWPEQLSAHILAILLAMFVAVTALT